MEKIQIEPSFSVSGPICESDIVNLKNDGVTRLICARFDNEEVNQAAASEMAVLAEQYGLKYFHVPVKSKVYKPEDIRAFANALGEQNDKVHGYCRTGTRAAHLWALSQVSPQKAVESLRLSRIDTSLFDQ